MSVGVGYLYVDVTYREAGAGDFPEMFVASVSDEGVIAAASSLERVRECALRWAEMEGHELPIRFRYSDRAKLAMG